VTWLAAGSLLGGLERELAEGIAALLAAFVLLFVTHWVIGQATAKRFMGAIAEQFARVGRGRATAVGVLSLSFVAAYREAFEVVLFFKALSLDAAGAEERVAFGIAAGLAALLGVAFTLRALGRRLQPRPLLLASSALLALISFALLGKGVRALQEADVVSLHALSWPELPVLGIHATVEGLAAQAFGLLVIFASTFVVPRLQARTEASRPSAG
jgi:high-affinity iron transporter